jgi:hypothetical protein
MHIIASSRSYWYGLVAWAMAGLLLYESRETRPGGSEMSAGEAPIKQAVKWIEEQLARRPGADRLTLVDEAAREFDLSPLDTDFILRHLAERQRKS